MVDWLDGHDRLGYLPLIDADEHGLLYSLPQIRRHASFHLILPEGKIRSGSDAIPDLLALLPLGRIAVFLIRSVPGGMRCVSFVYSTFSRLHNTGSCTFKKQDRLSDISFGDKEVQLQTTEEALPRDWTADNLSIDNAVMVSMA